MKLQRGYIIAKVAVKINQEPNLHGFEDYVVLDTTAPCLVGIHRHVSNAKPTEVHKHLMPLLEKYEQDLAARYEL